MEGLKQIITIVKVMWTMSPTFEVPNVLLQNKEIRGKKGKIKGV